MYTVNCAKGYSKPNKQCEKGWGKNETTSFNLDLFCVKQFTSPFFLGLCALGLRPTATFSAISARRSGLRLANAQPGRSLQAELLRQP